MSKLTKSLRDIYEKIEKRYIKGNEPLDPALVGDAGRLCKTVEKTRAALAEGVVEADELMEIETYYTVLIEFCEMANAHLSGGQRGGFSLLGRLSHLVRAQRNIISAIDKLRAEHRAALEGLDVSLPEIVVIGQESSGKSSLLESISHQRLWPRDDDICTRVPMVLQMRFDGQADTAYVRHNGSKVRLADTPALIKTLTDEKAPGTYAMGLEKSCEITLELFGKDLVDLTLVDLPGVVSNQREGQPVDIEKLTGDCSKRYANSPNAIVLCVVDSDPSKYSNDNGIKLLHDVEPSRVIIVMTKIDRLRNAKEAKKVKVALRGEDAIIKEDKASARFAVISAPDTLQELFDLHSTNHPSDNNSNTLENQEFKKEFERQTLKDSLYVDEAEDGDILEKLGVASLTQELKKRLEKHITTVWAPRTRAKISHKRDQVLRELAVIGAEVEGTTAAILLAEVKRPFSDDSVDAMVSESKKVFADNLNSKLNTDVDLSEQFLRRHFNADDINSTAEGYSDAVLEVAKELLLSIDFTDELKKVAASLRATIGDLFKSDSPPLVMSRFKHAPRILESEYDAVVNRRVAAAEALSEHYKKLLQNDLVHISVNAALETESRCFICHGICDQFDATVTHRCSLNKLQLVHLHCYLDQQQHAHSRTNANFSTCACQKSFLQNLPATMQNRAIAIQSGAINMFVKMANASVAEFAKGLCHDFARQLDELGSKLDGSASRKKHFTEEKDDTRIKRDTAKGKLAALAAVEKEIEEILRKLELES